MGHIVVWKGSESWKFERREETVIEE